jgi:hypothetical protein
VSVVAARRGRDQEHPLPRDPAAELIVDFLEDGGHELSLPAAAVAAGALSRHNRIAVYVLGTAASDRADERPPPGGLSFLRCS